ncbi:hypothetical protein JCM8547_009284 [Rhodosporidiobolus lusitaniae]
MSTLSPHLVPTPGTSWKTARGVKDLLAERQRNSPVPPPSPGLSDGGFSTWEGSPATFQSPTFNCEHHSPFFRDEPFTPELGHGSDGMATPDMGGSSREGSEEPAGTIVFGPLVHEENDEDDEDDDLPLIRPRLTSVTMPPSPSTFTDRLSTQSLTITDTSCSPSPSLSIASVRMARVTKVPNSRLSMGTSSVLSESVEDAPEDAVWDDKALARTSFVDRLPQDLALMLQENERRERAAAAGSSASTTPVESSTAPARPPTRQAPLPPSKDEADLPKSSSKESELSSESWKAHLDESVRQMVADPTIKPDADAMQRMKSILGPKTRIISKAPWDGEPVEEPVNFGSRRSLDLLSGHRSTTSVDFKSASKGSKERQKENLQSNKTARTRSFSVLTARRANTLESSKEQEEALKGLGLGLGLNTSISGSDSKRSLKSLLKQSSTLAESESFSDFMSTTPPATVRVPKHSSPAALPFPSRPAAERTDSTGKVPRTGRTPPPAGFEMLPPVDGRNSPKSTDPLKSAPASVTFFPSGFSRSGSKASLLSSFANQRPHGSTSPQPSTPTALNGYLFNPSSPGPHPGSPSYFTSIPGAHPNRGNTPPGFGHKLISLEEARKIQEDERAAAAARTRESTGESLSNRRGVPPPTAITTTSPSASIPAPAPPPPVLAAPKALKPKRSGFLRRMMGNADKHERPEMPSAPLAASFRSVTNDDPSSIQPSISSASIPTLATATPPSSLGRASGLKIVESPSAMSGRVSFMPTPPTDPNQRIRKGVAAPAPALSLRPISMAFSAGLPSDFLAVAEASASASTTRPTTTRSSSIPTPAPSIPLASPQAPSFGSSTSTAALSLFDEASSPPSGSTTPLTPAFLSISLSSTSGGDDSSKTALDRLLSLQDEYARAKRAWKTQRTEMEAQVRALQVELEKTREEQQAERKEASREVKEGEECSKCGQVVKARREEGGGEVRLPELTSVIQRPRFKGNGGVGTLFGSGVAA